MTRLRVLSYNVLSLRMGMSRVAAVIEACEPDVVCVQEAPRFLGWRRRCAGLARASGLVVVTGGRPAGAVLLLARGDLAVRERRNVKLPWHPPLHRRGMAIGVFDVGGTDVVVASTHLSLEPNERRAQAAAELRILGEYAAPAVLAGDVNEEPDGEAFGLLAATLHDGYAVAPEGAGPTSNAIAPQRRIDAVFVDPRLVVVGCGVPPVAGLAEASDHCPVLADIDVP